MAPNSHADWLRFNIRAITDMLSQDMSALNRMSFEKLKADLEADLAQELEDEKISPEEKAWLDKAAKDIADLKFDMVESTLLMQRIKELEAGIRKHRDASFAERCWHADVELYKLVDKSPIFIPPLPDHETYMIRCEEYYECSRQIYEDEAETKKPHDSNDEALKKVISDFQELFEDDEKKCE